MASNVSSEYTAFSCTEDSSGTRSIAIGNFDGIHIGHQELISVLKEDGKVRGASTLVFTFSPHPRIYFGRLVPEDLLFSRDQKLKHLDLLGVDEVLEQRFNEEFCQLSAADFVESVLVKHLKAVSVIVGENFRFGKDRGGNASWLQKELLTRGIACKIFPHKHDKKGGSISSSAIRSYLKEGSIETANGLLGRPYTVSGEVKRGNQLGRQLGFPTANIPQPEQLFPGTGVYICLCRREQDKSPGWQKAVVNCGRRPSVGSDGRAVVEVHFLNDPEEDLYGKRVEVSFLSKIRNEKKFDSLESLKKQISLDVEKTTSYFEKERHLDSLEQLLKFYGENDVK